MNNIRIYKSGIHFGEEPIIAGNEKSGMINFSGCHLRCNFCYTKEASFLNQGTDYTEESFNHLLESLTHQSAKNLNFISPTLAWPAIEKSLKNYSAKVPLILKISGYENKRYIESMRAHCDIWVPDFKVVSEKAALSVNLPKNYGAVTLKAIQSMMKSHNEIIYDAENKVLRGIIVRHLVMPNYEAEAHAVIESLKAIDFKGYFNLMTNFIDPKSKKLMKANAKDINAISDKIKNTSIKLLINGLQGANHGL
jgi:putative pyruvate formate lyase activating enzyme